MSADSPSRALSRLEQLPTEVLNVIGTHLESADLKTLRITSSSMNKQVEFNLKELFKEIKCRTTLAEFAALARFKERRLADAIESLIWVKPGSTRMFEEEIAWERQLEQWGMLPGLTALGICNEEEPPPTPPEISDLDLPNLIAQSVHGFPNLRAFGLAFTEDSEEAEYRSLPHLEDFDIWIEAILKFERPLDAFVRSEEGSFGVYWTGNRKTTGKLFFETLLSFEALNDHKMPWNLEIWLRESFAVFYKVSKFHKTILGQGLRSLELHRTVLMAKDIAYFCDACNLEELKIWESAIFCATINFAPLTDRRGRFRKTMRNLTMLDCTLQPRDPAGLAKFFTDLRDECCLEQLCFERVGGLQFDWNNDGARDDGARLPHIIGSCGIKAALTKMSCCLVISEQPNTRFSEVTDDWRVWLTFGSPGNLPRMIDT